ncbi:MAG: WbqC family protein [Candidatus Cloacimonadaceae bacterium]|nr:WbqC family protein [Candidatus Cloacimonadaceae bacterium]
MKLAVMQPYFLPYLGAYQHVYAVDKYIIYGSVNFRNNGWFNRNRLMEKNKGPRYFNIPMIESSFLKTFRDIEVDPSQRWRVKLLRTIELNYNKCDYYAVTFDLIRGIVLCDLVHLDEFNANSMIMVSKHLDINTQIVLDRGNYAAIETELGSKFDETIESGDIVSHDLDKKTARIIEICKQEQAATYVNPIGGQALYSKSVFKANGIELLFLKTREIRYKQMYDSFEPNLSILDVLMNCGKDQTKELIKEYDLV